MKVQIVQPALPAYRIPLFAGLADSGLTFSLHISISDLNSSEVLSGETELPFDLSLHHELHLLGGRVLWQRGLSLDVDLGYGDVLVVCGNPRYLSNFVLIYRAKKRGIRILWWGHGWSAGSRGLSSRVRIKLMTLADLVLLYTDHERDQFLDMGFSPRKCLALNNTIETESINKAKARWSPEDLKDFRDSNGIGDSKLFIFCGRLTEKCGVEDCVKAISKLKEEGKPMMLAVIGGGEMAGQLKILAERLGILECVLWVGSEYDELCLAPWFMNAIAFVYPGAIGLSAMHALAYGLPVITHGDSNYHMPEFTFLEHRGNSLHFARGSIESLAGAMNEVAENAELRSSLSSEALRTVSFRYTLENAIERFKKAIYATAGV